jgi:hypothetical protein
LIFSAMIFNLPLIAINFSIFSGVNYTTNVLPLSNLEANGRSFDLFAGLLRWRRHSCLRVISICQNICRLA